VLRLVFDTAALQSGEKCRLKLKKSCNLPSPKGVRLHVSWRGKAAAENVQRPTFNIQRSRPNNLFKNVLLAA